MPTSGGWPAPPGDPVVVLLDASTDAERQVLHDWVERARGEAAGAADVAEVSLHDPELVPLLDRHLDEGGADPWMAPIRVAWLPEDHGGGDRAVRFRDVVRHLGDPRRPRPKQQERIRRDDPDRFEVVVAEPARASELRRRHAGWGTWEGTPHPELASFVTRQATLALERAERHLRGAQYKVPKLVREDLTSGERFRSGLAELARQEGRSVQDVAEEADGYLAEMVTGWTQSMIDLAVRFARYSFRRGYNDQLDLDADQVARIREAAGHSPLVFLPTHRSNMDTLVMTVALHDAGLPLPHVFGGINMAFWPVGSMYRRAGTVYIRRETRGKPVYTYALREYIAYLLEKRFSLQFYMEGGRTRTGKLLPPRLGLLAYVADAYRQGRSDDVALVPVSIAYDQLQEVGEYAREAKGGQKTAESLSWLVKGFREQRGRFGQIYVRFGEPLSLRDALGPPETGGDEDEQRLALQKAALEVFRRINDATPITATALVTFSLLGAKGRALTVPQIRAAVHDPLEYAERRELPLARGPALDTDEGLRHVLAELGRHKVVSRFADGPEEVYAIGEDQHLAAAFYRNSIIHFFLRAALAQAALARVVHEEPDDPLGLFWEAALAGRDRLKFDFFFAPRQEFQAALARELALEIPDWEAHLARGADGATWLLQELRPLVAHTVLRSFLEAYGVVAATLARRGDGTVDDEDELLDECRALGRQYLLQQRIQSAESLATPLFKTGVELAASRGLTDASATADGRAAFLLEIRQALRDLDIVELLATHRILRLLDGDVGERLAEPSRQADVAREDTSTQAATSAEANPG